MTKTITISIIYTIDNPYDLKQLEHEARALLNHLKATQPEPTLTFDFAVVGNEKVVERRDLEGLSRFDATQKVLSTGRANLCTLRRMPDGDIDVRVASLDPNHAWGNQPDWPLFVNAVITGKTPEERIKNLEKIYPLRGND